MPANYVFRANSTRTDSEANGSYIHSIEIGTRDCAVTVCRRCFSTFSMRTMTAKRTCILYSSRNESFLTEQLNADTVHQQTWLQSVACFVDFSFKYFGLSHVFFFALLAHYEVGLSNKRLSIQFVFAVIDHSIFFLGEILNNFRWFFIEIGWKTDSLFSFIIQRASALWTSNMEDLR